MQLHFLAGFLYLLGLFLVFQGVSYFYRTRVRTRVEGEVAGMSTSTSGGGTRRNHSKQHEFHVSYELDGVQKTSSIGTGGGTFPHYPAGSRVTLLLSDSNPAKVEFYTRQEVALRFGLLVIGIALVTIAVVIWMGMYGFIEIQKPETAVGCLWVSFP